MNLLGIIQLRDAGLRGPRAEQIFITGKDLLEKKVKSLYAGTRRDFLTLSGFDLRKPWNCAFRADRTEFKEHEVHRKYFIKKAKAMYKEMAGSGIPEKSIAFILHESYCHNDVSYAGHAITVKRSSGDGHLTICSGQGLAKRGTELPFECTVLLKNSEIMIDKIGVARGLVSMFEKRYIQEIYQDLNRLHNVSLEVSSLVNFIVYFGQEQLVYTDMKGYKS